MAADKFRTIKGVQSSSDPFVFILSSESTDRVGDVIRQSGWQLENFLRNPIALFGHDHSFPIGVWEDVKVAGKKLQARLRLAERGTSARIDEIRGLIEQGILRAVSVGFRVLDYKPIDKNDPYGAWDILKSELLETSVVSVPANPEALQVAKSMGVSSDTLELVFRERSLPATRSQKTAGLAAPTSLKPKTRKELPMAGRFATQIAEAASKLETLRDQIEEITNKSIEEERDLDENELSEIEALETQIRKVEVSKSALEKAERALAKNSEGARPRAVPATAKADKAVDVLFKAAGAAAVAHLKKSSMEAVVAERYGDDPRVEAFTKAAVTGATTTASGWASQLVDDVLTGFIELLTPVSVYGPLANAGVALPFGDANSITMPRRTANDQVPGSFVQEAATIPVKRATFGSTTFNRFKMAVITSFSNELAEVSNPRIEGIMRQAIVEDTAISIDSNLLNVANAGVANVKPASPFNGGATQASAGADLASILTDLRFLMDTLSNANAGRSPVLIMNPARLSGLMYLTNANGSFVFRDELSQGRLMGVPVVVSTNVPAAVVYMIDAADFGTAFGVPMFAASEQATLVMADDDGVAPTMTATDGVTTAGSLNVSDAAGTTPPTAVRSMFQTYETALRMVLPISWGMLRPGTVAYITATAW